jgi:hypothetical protein
LGATVAEFDAKIATTYNGGMELTVGKVVDGKVVVEGSPLVEGATVAVVIKGEETFTATAEEERVLLEAMAQADSGEVVDGWDLLQQIRPRPRALVSNSK